MRSPGASRSGRAGVSETGAELGGALGIALLGSIGVAVYGAQMADSVVAQLDSDLAEAAEDTLGGAREVVGGLGDERGTALLEAAQAAFAQGLQVASVAAAAVALGTAVIAAVYLRRAGTGSPPAPDASEAPDVAVEAARP